MSQPAGLSQSTPDVGIMMLDNELPRPRGDVGNTSTFDFPVAYDVIQEAETTRVIERNAEGLLPNALESARRLVLRGARAVTTCCGFLAIYQRELGADLDVPVATSSLLQIPLALQTLRPDQRVAVVTVNGSTLTARHFESAGLTAEQRGRIRVVGLENTDHFYPMIVGEVARLDLTRARHEVVSAVENAVEEDRSIGAVVFECTNLPPYADAVRQATGLPVWDAVTMISWLRAGVSGAGPAGP